MRVRDSKAYLIQIERHGMKVQTANFFMKRVLQEYLCLVSGRVAMPHRHIMWILHSFLIAGENIHYYCGSESVALWVLLKANDFFFCRDQLVILGIYFATWLFSPTRLNNRTSVFFTASEK